jgi:hypothetical protein
MDTPGGADEDAVPGSSIEIFTNRDWYADPRLGEYIVYLDGHNVGRVHRPGRLLIPCESGDHVLRVRQWWYLSARHPFRIHDGERLSIEADLTHRDSLLRRFLQLMFVPWRGLSLTNAETNC